MPHCHNLRLFMACFACENPSPFYLSEELKLHLLLATKMVRTIRRTIIISSEFALGLQASTKIMTIFSTSLEGLEFHQTLKAFVSQFWDLEKLIIFSSKLFWLSYKKSVRFLSGAMICRFKNFPAENSTWGNLHLI